MPTEPIADLTDNAVLGGLLRLRQQRRGHRVGHDAILLAAATPARPGERVVDLGAGVGAAGLAVATRLGGIDLTLVEIDARLAALAAGNARRNGIDARVIVLDVAASAREQAAAGLVPEAATRVLMNPPFNDPERQRQSPEARRRVAHMASRETLAVWVGVAARLLRPRGTLSLVWRADGLGEVLAALGGGWGSIKLLPVHPKPGVAAIRILIGATKASRAPLSILPGLMLNDSSGRPTPEAEAVLRSGSALVL